MNRYSEPFKPYREPVPEGSIRELTDVPVDTVQSHKEFIPEKRIDRRQFFFGSSAVVAAGILAVGASYLRDYLNSSLDTEAKPLIYTHRVEAGETLSSITTDLYEDKSGNDAWVNAFIDNNIVNTEEDSRPRNRDTIYEGDLLEITLDPNEEIPQSITCPIPEKTNILKDNPDCYEGTVS